MSSATDVRVVKCPRNVRACPECNSPIARGAEAVHIDGGKYVHAACYQRGSQPELTDENGLTPSSLDDLGEADEIVFSDGTDSQKMAGENPGDYEDWLDPQGDRPAEDRPGVTVEEVVEQVQDVIDAVTGEIDAGEPEPPEDGPVELSDTMDGFFERLLEEERQAGSIPEEPESPDVIGDDSDQPKDRAAYLDEVMDKLVEWSEEKKADREAADFEPERPKAIDSPQPRAESKRNDFDFQAAVDEAAKRIEEKIGHHMQAALDIAAQAVVPAVRKKLESQLFDLAQTACQSMLEQAKGSIDALHAEARRAIVQTIQTEMSAQSRTIHVIERPDGSKTEIVEVVHEAFDEFVSLASGGFNVALIGPTGSGKTALARQVAKACGLEFGMVSGTDGTTESEFFGTSYPNVTTGDNVYHGSDFVRLFEEGGLFLVDEADAINPNCFLKINAAVSNGMCVVPKRFGKTTAVKHPNFVFVVALNTRGQGASRMYCGRSRLDESSIDRWRSGTVEVDYSPRIEAAICPDTKLLAKLREWRRKIEAGKVQRVLSTRFVGDAYRLKSDLKKSDDYIAAKLTGGWTAGEVQAVIGYIPKAGK